MKIAVVTTFNHTLHEEYAYKFMQTYNWNFDLHVYSEDALLINAKRIDFSTVEGHDAFVRRNKKRGNQTNWRERSLDFKWDGVRFSHKSYAWCDFILNKSNRYDGLIFIDADSTFKVPIDYSWIAEHIHRDNCMVTYMGRPTYTETGFIYFNLKHNDVKDFAAEVKSYYDEDKIWDLEEYTDCWVFDTVRKQFETEKSIKNYSLGDGNTGHIQSRTVLAQVYSHNKGGSK